MGKQAVTVSYRLGGADGVSVEQRKWGAALEALGFATRRVAGVIEDDGHPDDVEIPELAIDAPEPPSDRALRTAFDGADLLVVDNVCSLPLNHGVASAVADAALAHHGRTLFRHHDLPWQRRHLSHLETAFPPRKDGALHATINLRSRREMEARGYDRVTTIHNYFDLAPEPGAREATRARFGFPADALVLLQPARAIERKNVPGGLRFAQRLMQFLPDTNVQYWLSGPAEDGYEPVLERLLDRTSVPFTIGRAATSADAYAAADLVVFPSTWEGFGNPVVEAIAHRRPLAAFPYPVLAELLATGVRVFPIEQPETLMKFLAEPDDVRARYHDVNLHRASLSFDLADLPGAIDAAFAQHGWPRW